MNYHIDWLTIVSTHSRAEAAALELWSTKDEIIGFQHTAARRRLHFEIDDFVYIIRVSTHSRAEAAAFSQIFTGFTFIFVSTHSRAEAAAPYIKQSLTF